MNKDYIVAPGSLCIWGEADRPCAAMIVMVIECFEEINGAFRQELAKVRYLAHRPQTSPNFNEVRIAPRDKLIPIEQFGIFYAEQSAEQVNILRFQKYGPSKAQYGDGETREWQGDLVMAADDSVLLDIERSPMRSLEAF